MIQIQSAIDKKDPRDYLDAKSILLFNHLNKYKTIRSIKKYNKRSLIEKCNSLLEETNTDEYKEEYATNSNEILQRQIKFYSYLKADGYKNIRRIITSKPEELKGIIEEVSEILHQDDMFTIQNGKIKQTKFGSLISGKLFKYSTYRVSQFCIDLYKDLGFTSISCPYCNLNRLRILPKQPPSKPSHRLLFDLDHFYPKSIYPFLALSFYNHIPCCTDCNSKIKLDKNFTVETHVNPYLESFDDLYKFDIPNTVLIDHKVSKVIIKNLDIKPHDCTPDDLELTNRYNIDFDDVNRLIKTFADYKHYIDDGKTEELKRYIFDMHGVKRLKGNILEQEKSKLLRDMLKIYDVGNALNLD